MMTKQGKIWGETEEIYNNGIVSINRLKIRKGGYCSEHCHARKANIFYVITGNLKLEIWRGADYSLKDETVVWPGEQTTVEPGVYHKFEALTDVECLEIYETRLVGEDIERRTTGGIH